MKKTVCVCLLISAAVTLVLIGCSRQEDDPNDIRLKVLAVWNGGYKTPRDQYNNPIAEIIREKIGVTVEFEGIMMGEIEKLNLMFASGDIPDIVNAPFWGGSEGATRVIKKAATEGRLMPIEDYLEKYPNIGRAYDIGVISQIFLENDLDDPEFNGHRYFIPTQTPGNVDQIVNWAYGIFVRGDVPRALGIDERSIKTQEQLFDFMIQARDYGFRDVNGNNTIVASTFQNGWASGEYINGFSDSQRLSGLIFNEDGTYSDTLFTDNWIDSNLFIWRMINEGLLDKECFRHSNAQANQKIGSGTALFFAAQYEPGILITKQTGLYQAHPEMRYVPVGPLHDRNGFPLVQPETEGRTGSPVLFFPSNGKNTDAAMRFIDFINTPEGLELVTYGIEGVTFIRNSEGQPRLIPELAERQASGDITWEDTLREMGVGYIANLLVYGDKRIEWFGEESPGAADAAIPELAEYKLMRPVKVLSGYPLSAFTPGFPEIDRLSVLWDNNYANTYVERAFFAPTEAEARRILVEYQDFARAFDNGVYMEFLEYLVEMAASRDDIIF